MDGQTDRRMTTVPIARPLLKYGQLKIKWATANEGPYIRQPERSCFG